MLWLTATEFDRLSVERLLLPDHSAKPADLAPQLPSHHAVGDSPSLIQPSSEAANSQHAGMPTSVQRAVPLIAAVACTDTQGASNAQGATLPVAAATATTLSLATMTRPT